MGPLLFALVQTSLEEGFRAGLAIGAGIWISDILFVGCAVFGVSYILAIMEWEGFSLTLGIVGTLILFAVGLGLIIVKPPILDDLEKARIRYSSYFSLWLKGFLINTVNPFTFLFWFIIASAKASEYKDFPGGVGKFYLGILATILLTDFLKIVLAKWIQPWLEVKYILLMRKIAGSALILLGIGLLVRSWLLFQGEIEVTGF